MTPRAWRWVAGVTAGLVALLGNLVPAAAESTPVISLYTMGPGSEVWTKYGHAAVCVEDDVYPAGRCYNYGSANFSTPVPLGLGVLQGDAEFWVSTIARDKMIAIYQGEDRTIWRQTLPLSADRAKQLRYRFAVDAMPNNRVYQYDHFDDNCATRPRDHIDAIAQQQLLRKASFPLDATYRDLVRDGLRDDLALLVLSEIFLGRALDRRPTEYEAMFLPRYLRGGVESYLDVPAVVVYERRGPPASGDPLAGQMLLFVIAIGLGLPGLVLGVLGRESRWTRLARGLPATVVSAIGGLIVVLVVLSPVPALRLNELLLVLVPFDVLLWSRAGWLRGYLWARLGLLGLVASLVLAGVFLQPLWGLWLLATLLVIGELVRRRQRAAIGQGQPATVAIPPPITGESSP